MNNIKLNNFNISNELPFTLIAGPCQAENRDHAFMMAEEIKKITDDLEINYIFKTSFDKANRTSVDGKRGLGLEKTLPIFSEVKQKLGLAVLTDVHNEIQCDLVRDYVDIIQIPAFLCRQTDILKAAAQTGKIINIKKGQFLAPHDVKNIVNKVESFGNKKILLTERGVSFGYNNLVSDMRSLPIMAQTGYPVIFDATHSVQQPSGHGEASGGQREFVETLSRAAVAVGVGALFMEVHDDPDNAPSDGPCMIKLENLKDILSKLKNIDSLVKS